MSEESKEVDPEIDNEAAKEVINPSPTSKTDFDENDDAEEDDGLENKSTDNLASTSNAKKKKSKKARLKKALGVDGRHGNSEVSTDSAHPASKLTTGMVEQLLEMNPSLKGEVAGMGKEKAAEALKKLDVADLITGMVFLRILLQCISNEKF